MILTRILRILRRSRDTARAGHSAPPARAGEGWPGGGCAEPRPPVHSALRRCARSLNDRQAMRIAPLRAPLQGAPRGKVAQCAKIGRLAQAASASVSAAMAA